VESDNNYSDFLLKEMDINTSKVAVKDRILSTEPVNLTMKSLSSTTLDFYYWLEGKDQDIQIDGDTKETVRLSKDLINQHTRIKLEPGLSTVNVPKGNVAISGKDMIFALTPASMIDIYRQSNFQLNRDPNVRTDYKIFEIIICTCS
jgi:hypothetical protein